MEYYPEVGDPHMPDKMTSGVRPTMTYRATIRKTEINKTFAGIVDVGVDTTEEKSIEKLYAFLKWTMNHRVNKIEVEKYGIVRGLSSKYK